MPIGETKTLTATVLPTDVPNKGVTWKSSDTGIATVDSNGVVTGVATGTATITATSVANKSKSASCSVNVTDESDWKEIAKVAKLVAEDSSINNRTTEVTKDGMTIKVGQEFTLSHDGIKRKVRVLGFNHDTLTNPTAAYGAGTKATKAGISFEFVECMIDDYKEINTSWTSENGWKATLMRTFLEGTDGIGKISEICRKNIKQVKKQYIKVYDDPSSNNNYSDDRLWLLSCSEIWSKANDSKSVYGRAVAKEGEQYKWYVDNEGGSPKTTNLKIVKTHLVGSTRSSVMWWLRSPAYQQDQQPFCTVSQTGTCNAVAGDTYYVAPGFCI